MKRETIDKPVRGVEHEDIVIDLEALDRDSPAHDGDAAVNRWRIETPTTRCERCSTEFYALFTNGRCTACGHRHHEKKAERAAHLARRLTELARSPRSFVQTLRRSGRSNSQDS